ncbi:hypothetical protein D9758_013049 [Tetrapyrgos nigripes]|uniref:glutathione transferase n=1 Tax=Tetrapyrgos nigripes TaxID=182062 RepID=A0A8H5FR28_9AGAR|nr:hypothetical protein D9758_013049 [Tetrapyrgos nigripes]
MTLKIYGYHNSTCSKRVAVVLYSKKIPHEFIPVDIVTAKENRSAEFLEKQPFGQVPILEDDEEGIRLYESRAICRYLEGKYPDKGPKLIPSDSDKKGKAMFEQAASTEAANFDPYASKAAFQTVIRK